VAACPASAALPQVRSDSEPARKGTAVHLYLACLASGRSREEALDEVPAEYRAACGAIDVSRLPTLEYAPEVAFAYDYATGNARELGRGLDRGYPDLGPTEIPMTLDSVGVGGSQVVVFDVKTGRGRVTPAARNGQIRLGALAAARAYGASRATVGLVYVREGEAPWSDVADLDEMDLDAAAIEARDVMRRVGEAAEVVTAGGTPTLTTGDHCRYCPARTACPARVALLRACVQTPEEIRARVFAGLEQGERAQAYRLARQIEVLGRELLDALRTSAADEPIDLGDGLAYGLCKGRDEIADAGKCRTLLLEGYGDAAANAAVTVEYHTTKGDIEDALKAAGEKPAARRAFVEKLRAAGAVKAGWMIKEHKA